MRLAYESALRSRSYDSRIRVESSEGLPSSRLGRMVREGRQGQLCAWESFDNPATYAVTNFLILLEYFGICRKNCSSG